MKVLLLIPLILILISCSTPKSDHTELLKAWTPEVRDTFIEMGKMSGCFDLKKVKGSSCYSAVFIYNKNKKKWEIYCRKLSQREAPECYENDI